MSGGPGLDSIGDEEVAAVVDALRSRQLSRYRFDEEAEGADPSYTFRFERELQALAGVRHCLGMNSCTSALLTGLWALEIGPGDEVIVPGYTFVASMAAVAYTGADLVLAEVDGRLGLDPADVERRITRRTRAVICVHMLGMPCDVQALKTVADRHGLILVEDCAQSAGGSFQGRAVGAIGRFGAFSLNVFKTFTAGDGGVFLTNDDALYERAFAIHDHGARPLRLGVAEADGLMGLNFRMHELTGAVALAQLRKLPANLEQLRWMKAALAKAIGPLPGVEFVAAHDPAGECATVLPLRFDTAARARVVADRLGVRTLSQSGKHNYANIPQLARRSTPAAIHPSAPGCDRFTAGALPRTDDLLARTVILSIGVRDSYLGAGFGLHLGSRAEEITSVASRVRSAVGAEP